MWKNKFIRDCTERGSLVKESNFLVEEKSHPDPISRSILSMEGELQRRKL